jgi:hypothetical protein
MRQGAAENGRLEGDSGAVPQNPELGRKDEPVGAEDVITSRLRETLGAWLERRDAAELRRSVLDLLLRLER